MVFEAREIKDVVAWWKEQVHFPLCQRLVKDVWCEQASSASVERTLGNTSTDKRTRLTPANAERLAVCSGNADLVNTATGFVKWQEAGKRRASQKAVAVAPEEPAGKLLLPPGDELKQLQEEFEAMNAGNFKVIKGKAGRA